VALVPNNGDGTFSCAVLLMNCDSIPSSVVVGDFDLDGKPDLAVATCKSNYAGSVLLSQGDGTFAPRLDIASTSSWSRMAVGDFNRDGRLDLAVADSGSSTARALLASCAP
jgi:hypothetical protein